MIGGVVLKDGLEDFITYFKEPTEEKVGELPPYDESIPFEEKDVEAESKTKDEALLTISLINNEELSKKIVALLDIVQQKLLKLLLERKNFSREELLMIEELRKRPFEELSEKEKELLMDYDYLTRKIEEQVPISTLEKIQLETALSFYLDSIKVELTPGKFLVFSLLMIFFSRIINYTSLRIRDANE